MKPVILLIVLSFLLSACSFALGWETEKIISDLERRITEEQALNKQLQKKNEDLEDQIRKLKAGLWNNEFWEVTPMEGGFTSPEEMTYKEVSNEACIKKAQDEYVTLGNKQCHQMGHTEADIKDKKCKLSREFIDVIQKKLQDAVIACGPGQ